MATVARRFVLRKHANSRDSASVGVLWCVGFQ